MQGSESGDASVPSLEGAIRNPNNPNHLMVIRRVRRAVSVHVGDTLIAQTHDALRVLEMGKSLYDPAIYIPASDIIPSLEPVDKSTHCPLKGDASYVSFNGNEIAWTYDRPFEWSGQLRGHVAFDAGKVTIEVTGTDALV